MASPFILSLGLMGCSLAAWPQVSLVHLTSCHLPAIECKVSPTGSGNLIVIGWQVNQPTDPGSATIRSASDNVGNIYKMAFTGQSLILSNRSSSDIWYAANGLPGATSLSLRMTSDVAEGRILIWEFSGIDAGHSPDQFQMQDWIRLVYPMSAEKGSQPSISNGKTLTSKTAASTMVPANACDINQDGSVDVLDAQSAVNTSCSEGICNGGLAQQVINASLGRPCTHSVLLTWTANPGSNVAGYNVYRGSTPGGSFSKMNYVLVSGASYVDATVEAGKSYYYVATTVDSSNAESAYSSPVFAAVPSP